MAQKRLAIVSALFAPTAFAAPTSSESLATTLAALLAVIGLIFALAWLLKRMKVPSLMGAKPGLKVVSQLPLGQRERVMVLDVNGEQVLIGVTSQQITLLKSLDTPMGNAEDNTKATNASPKTSDANSAFSSQLNKILKNNDAS
ncbi:flagellar biosynthetic protein FliO [Enterovibrio norvegicus]|uniref:flagellar biosynthetic protein FliO n=1 Tax=Enterovibrio norvegicus TaxID=188144 RepID=UPI003066887E